MAEIEEKDKAEIEKKVNIKALKEFFGFREGKSISDFAQELKALTDEEKQQLSDGIVDGSLTY